MLFASGLVLAYPFHIVEDTEIEIYVNAFLTINVKIIVNV